MISGDDDSDNALEPIEEEESVPRQANQVVPALDEEQREQLDLSASSAEEAFVKSEFKHLKKKKADNRHRKHKHKKHKHGKKKHHHHHRDDDAQEEETQEEEEEEEEDDEEGHSNDEPSTSSSNRTEQTGEVGRKRRRRDRRRSYHPRCPVMETGEQLLKLRVYDVVNGRDSEREIAVPMGFYYCSKKESEPQMKAGYRAGIRLNALWNLCDTGLLNVKKFKGRVKQSRKLPLRGLPRFNVDPTSTSPEVMREIYYGDSIQYVVSFRELPDVLSRISDTLCVLTSKEDIIQQMREFLENYGRYKDVNEVREEELEAVNTRAQDPSWGEPTSDTAVVMIRRHQESQDAQFTGLLESVSQIKETVDEVTTLMLAMRDQHQKQFSELALSIAQIKARLGEYDSDVEHSDTEAAAARSRKRHKTANHVGLANGGSMSP